MVAERTVTTEHLPLRTAPAGRILRRRVQAQWWRSCTLRGFDLGCLAVGRDGDADLCGHGSIGGGGYCPEPSLVNEEAARWLR